MQFGVFGFGSFEDVKVRIGVFPECEEILIGRLRFGSVPLQSVRASNAEMS